MQVIRVKMADVYPVQDEYGNTYASRDFSTKANKEYVQALADTFQNGEPDTPPMLIEDGGIYRIKDGNCRIEAMRLLGTKEFTAIIDERSSVQDVIATVIRTDTKKKYEDIERSRFVQQLAMFADDDYVAKAAHLEPKQVSRIRKGAAILGDAAEDMTLDHLMAIEEFAGDPDMIEKIKNLSPKELDRAIDAERRRRADRERVRDLTDALKDRGVTMTGKVPDGYAYYMRIGSAENIPKELPPDTVCVVPSGEGSSVVLLVPETDDPEQQNEIRGGLMGHVDSLIEATLKRRITWLADAFKRRGDLRPLLKLCDEYTKPTSLQLFEQVSEQTVPHTITDIAMMAFDWSPRHAYNLISSSGKANAEEITRYLCLVDTMEECGYQLDAAETDLYNLLTEMMNGGAEDGR